MKLKDLIIARHVIYNHKEDKIPARLSYKLMKIMKASDNEEAFYYEKHKKLVNQYAIKDDDGTIKEVNGEYRIQADQLKNYQEAVYELNNTEVEIPSVKFSLDDLETLNFSIEEMFYLDAFIEE